MIRITCPRPCQNECRAVKHRRSRHQQQKASHMRWTSRNSTTAQPCSVTIEKRESVCKAVAKLLGVQWHRTTPPHVHTTRSHVRLCSHGLQRNSANFQQNPVHLRGQLIFPCWLHLQLVGKGFRSLQLTKMSNQTPVQSFGGCKPHFSRVCAAHGPLVPLGTSRCAHLFGVSDRKLLTPREQLQGVLDKRGANTQSHPCAAVGFDVAQLSRKIADGHAERTSGQRCRLRCAIPTSACTPRSRTLMVCPRAVGGTPIPRPTTVASAPVAPGPLAAPVAFTFSP